MATGERLIGLFQAFAEHDDGRFVAYAKCIVAEERGKGHVKLATSLERILDRTHRGEPGFLTLPPPPIDKDGSGRLVRLTEPKEGWDRLAWPGRVEATLRSVVDEWRHRDRLFDRGLSPRNRLLFYGPPGNGKTAAAGVIAAELSLPLVEVNSTALVNSHMGNTGQNLTRVAEYVSKFPCVVFLDEFDSISSSRTNDAGGAGRENNRIVGSILKILDDFPPTCLAIAATNMHGLIDPAAVRRFDAACRFVAPDVEGRTRIVSRLGGLDLMLIADHLVSRTDGLSGAEVERVVLDCLRAAAVGDVAVAQTHLDAALSEHQSRCLVDA